MEARQCRRSIQLLVLFSLVICFFSTASLSAASSPQLGKDVLRIFTTHCSKCHGGASPEASLDLTSFTSLSKGSRSGPVIIKGASEKSYLYQKISSRSMPPPDLAQPLDPDQIETIRKWIDAGAPGTDLPGSQQATENLSITSSKVSEEDRGFWSFRPLARPQVPKVKSVQRVRSPIDAFLLAKLESKGLTFSPDARKFVLIRRAYFDLVGLPPSPKEVQEFLADRRPDAYGRLIDRLLDSPHYGERWGRHWLDVAGYTDEASFASELGTLTANEGIWRYRDYVIRSFNADKPFDRFLTEQIAGDELVDRQNAPEYTPEIRDALIATGYLRTVKDLTDEPELKRPIDRYEVLYQVVEHFATGVLGLTVGCARCHDHKYDPIPQTDYYRLLAIFAPAYNPDDWIEPKQRYLPEVSKRDQEEIARYNAEIDRPLGELTKKLDSLLSPYHERLFESKLSAGVPEQLRGEVRDAFGMSPEKRTSVQKYLFAKLEPVLSVSGQEVEALLTEREKTQKAKLEERIATLKNWRRSIGKIQALWDVGSAPTIRLFHRGNIDSPGPEVAPGFLSVLSNSENSFDPGDARDGTTGRRLALARWLTKGGASPLTARVMANRVWMHHFGKGIVVTPGNFGRKGRPPTHPELLDWLASNFIKSGWSVKSLHKLIMKSTAYRQSSRRPPDNELSKAEDANPSNDLLWRMNIRRLDAEILRDAVLGVSGRLDHTIRGGPPVPLEWNADGLITPSENSSATTSHLRRSIYLFARRNYSMSFLDVFDFPVMSLNCTERINSATPLQSLTMLNSEFIMQHGGDCAVRVKELVGGAAPIEKRIGMTFLLTLARSPSTEEMEASSQHVARQEGRYLELGHSREEASRSAFASFCRMLMASNEFLYTE